jgi:chitin disaccharide deacetylase
MLASPAGPANGWLGYPPGARLLIVNADDFGMSAPVNEGVLRAVTGGVARSVSLMVPWPGAGQAMRLLRKNPGIDVGIHLSVVCDQPRYRCGPVAGPDAVPSLVDGSGMLYPEERSAELMARARLADLETEYRAQLVAVTGAGLRPSHLDWHCLADGGRPDIFEMTLSLAREHGLALRAHARASIGRLRGLRLPASDHGILDSYRLGGDPAGRAERYLQLLRELPPGLTEWAVHPALDGPELREAEPATWRIRHADHEFLVSARARETIEREGIVLLSHEPLRRVWAAGGSPP